MSAAYLEKLNADQRRAVEYGIGNGAAENDRALLVIAGAGSGKTSTLAHRVVHLAASGADIRRILLMTFSRRAAAEMTRRVDRISNEAFGSQAAFGTGMLSWAGTFHAIGARLLREYTNQIGLDPAFTIHDREDSADLMNIVRHDLGFSKQDRRFPTKATCLAIYSRAVNGEQELAAVLAKSFPWCCPWEDALRDLFAAYIDAKQRQHVLDYDDLLLYWAQMMCEPPIAEDVAGTVRSRAGRRVSGHEPAPGLDPAQAQAGRRRPDGRRRRRAIDLFVPWLPRFATFWSFPNQFTMPATVVTLERNYRSTEPILAASNAVIGLAAERFTKNLWSGRACPAIGRSSSPWPEEIDQARYVAERVLENRESGTALKAQAVLFRASHHSAPLEVELALRGIPFVKFGGLKFLDTAHVKDVLALPAMGGKSAGPRGGVPRAPAATGHRAGQGGGDPGSNRNRRLGCRPSRRYQHRAAAMRPSGLRSPISSAGCHGSWPVGRLKSRRCGAGTSPTSNASTTMRRPARPT